MKTLLKIALVVALFIGGLAGAALWMTRGLAEAAENFMVAFAEDRHEDAAAVPSGDWIGSFQPDQLQRPRSQWKPRLRARSRQPYRGGAALPKRWISVTAPVWAVDLVYPALRARCVAMAR